MHTITVVENVSLDGVAQAPASPEEDRRGGFEHGGWAFQHLASDPEAMERAMSGEPAAAMLLGHRTYDQLVGHWLSTPDDNPFTELLRTTPKHVATRDATVDLPHPNSHRLVGEATQTVAALKEHGEGELVVLGSLALVRDLTAAGLVDRFVLTTIPVVLGSGARLFEGSHVTLEVEQTWASERGAVVATYRVAR